MGRMASINDAAGRLLTDNIEEYDGSRCVHRPEKISPERLTELYWWLYRRLFTMRSILRRTIFNPGFRTRPMVFLFAVAVNLHYRRYIRRRVPPNIF